VSKVPMNGGLPFDLSPETEKTSNIVSGVDMDRYKYEELKESKLTSEWIDSPPANPEEIRDSIAISIPCAETYSEDDVEEEEEEDENELHKVHML
jgi:hypothetical protein